MKDTAKSPNYSLQQRDVLPVFEEYSPELQESPDREPFTTRDIIPQRSPTLPPHQYPIFMTLPEESAPELERSPRDIDARRPLPRRTESEAAKYLRQFHSGDRKYARSRVSRIDESAAMLSTTPSLSNTPFSAVSTATSYDSGAPSSPYRPLPPRTTSRSGKSGFVNGSLDLVTPITSGNVPSSWTSSGQMPYSDHSMLATSLKSYPAASKIAGGPVEGLMESYEKRYSVPIRSRSAGSSLMQLFKFEEMRAQPKP